MRPRTLYREISRTWSRCHGLRRLFEANCRSEGELCSGQRRTLAICGPVIRCRHVFSHTGACSQIKRRAFGAEKSSQETAFLNCAATAFLSVYPRSAHSFLLLARVFSVVG